MPVKENTIIEYLAKKYGSSISKRALWAWCGGAEADIVYDLPPYDGWGQMWEKAEGNETPSQIGLVREMLFDSPGEKTLLGYLDELAAERFKAEKAVADFFLFLLARTGATEHRLAALLYLLQDMPPDCILATTAPAIQAVRDDKLYADFETILPKFDDKCVPLASEVLVDWIEFYFEFLPEDAFAAPETPENVEPAKKRLATLRTLVFDEAALADGAASAEKPSNATITADVSGDEEPDKLEEQEAAIEETTRALIGQVEALKVQLSEPDGGFFSPAATMVLALIELLQTCRREKETIAVWFSAVQPIRDALWATR